MEERKKALKKMKICRFCFSSDENELTNIYQKEPKTVPLPIQIMSCVSIEVFANDGLPQLICNSCKQQTSQSYIFKTNCKKADDALKNFLQTGELIRPEIQKSQHQKTQKRPISKVSPVKDVRILSKKTPTDDPVDVKRMKLEDGTEVITLCITNPDDVLSQDETSRDSEQSPHTEPSNVNARDSDEEIFESSPPYNRSVQPEQVETDIFSCEYCEKSFPLEQLLDIHVMNHHHRERQFTCLQCDNKFFTKYDLTKHQLTHSDSKPFNCSVCDKVFGREALLRRHELIHRDTPKYMCTECDKTYVVKEDLDIHMKKHQKTRPFSCDLCRKSFVFKQGLERHMGSVHSEDKPYKCNYCEASFNTPIRLTRHITTHAGLRPYPCRICGRTFLLSHHLTRHMRSHYGKQPEEAVGQHKCDICSMSFRRKDSLINHSAIHSMVNLRCVICNTSFENAKMVKDHITSHLQGLPFPCEKCDYSFDTDAQLIEHEVKHAEMEYEEQIEKEVISEVKNISRNPEDLIDGVLLEEDEEELQEEEVSEEEIEQNEGHEITDFHISDMDDPSTLIPSKHRSSSNILDSSIETVVLAPQKSIGQQQPDGLSAFFKTEADTEDEEEEASHVTGEEEDGEEMEERKIKPIHRVEGTKMYQRKGPIQRKFPKVQPQTEIVQTAALDEINEPPNVPVITPDALNSLPSKKPVNFKVGDKVVKVQKFIISKQEMKNMAKLGILELKNGQVIMKTPGQPILNAKIKPVEQGDIESLIFSQKNQNRPPPIKQYERKGSMNQSFSSTTVKNMRDFD